MVIDTRIKIPLSIFSDEQGARLSLGFCFNKRYWKPEPLDEVELSRYSRDPSHIHGDVEPASRDLQGKEAIR